MRRATLALAIGASALAGCTTTKQMADSGFRPPAGDYSLVVLRPDVTVGLLTAGGTVEPRADWTDTARANLLGALGQQQAGRGGRVTIAPTARAAGTDPALLASLDQLHSAVGDAIKRHKYGVAAAALPTKKGRFDWTLGEEAVRFGQVSGYRYALFLHAEDSFASTGRVALQAVSLLGCAVGVCMMPHGGQQVAFASLVDLRTGQIVWYNVLQSSVGDIRTPDGARTMVDHLFAGMKPGTAAPAAAQS